MARLLFYLLQYLFFSKVGKIKSNLEKIGKNHVLFISTQIMGREERMAASLRSNGWTVSLVKLSDSRVNNKDCFKEIIELKSRLEMTVLVNILRVNLIHIFCNMGSDAYFLISKNDNPIALDIYDPYSGHQIPKYKRIIEKSVVNSVAAISCRDLRLKYLQKQYKYKIPGKSIYIIDPIPEVITKIKNESKDIRVVSLGWIDGKERTASIYRTIKALIKDKIHVHIYCSPLNMHYEKSMSDYRKLNAKSKYFHFEENIFGDNLLSSLRDYDFGLLPYEWNAFPMLEHPKEYDEEWLIRCGSARLMDFISSGLNIIASPYITHLWFLANRYSHNVIDLNEKFIQNPRKVIENSMSKDAIQYNHSLSYIGHYHSGRRLIKMYKSVAK